MSDDAEICWQCVRPSDGTGERLPGWCAGKVTQWSLSALLAAIVTSTLATAVIAVAALLWKAFNG